MEATTAVFWDLGGVVLSNAWDHQQRAAVAKRFGVSAEELEWRHGLLAEAFETGRLTLDAYLDHAVFDRPRDFDRSTFRDSMLAQSEALPESLALVAEVAAAGRVIMATLNNESRELNEYRIERFGLRRWFGMFCTSCYLGARKPTPEAFLRALGIAQRAPWECIFFDDREENVAAARAVGMQGIVFTSVAEARKQLQARGFV